MNNVKRKLNVVIILIIAIIITLLFLVFDQPSKPKPIQPIETPSVSEPVETQQPEVEIIDYDFDRDDSIQRLVNSDHPLDPSYEPSDLVEVPVTNNHDHQLLRKEASDALVEMFDAAKEEGIELKLVSGYRDYTLQKSLWYTYVNKCGYKTANRIDCLPGKCEHQLGLAVDLGFKDGKCELKWCVDKHQGYDWLVDNSYKYGYILRYPKDSEDITGLMYSPWSFRYLGKECAKDVYDSGFVFDTFVEKYKEAK